MAYIVPTTITFPPTGDAVGTTWRVGDRAALAYPNWVTPPASLPTPITGQIWPRGRGA